MKFSGFTRAFTQSAIATGVLAAAATGYAAEQSVDVSLEVQLGASDVELSGLQNVSFKLNDLPASGISESVQTFCLFSPTRLFNMTWRGQVKDVEGLNRFFVEDVAQSNGELNQLTYLIQVHDIFSGEEPLSSNPGGTFGNGVTETGIDSTGFNTDKTCSEGDNLQLTWAMPFPSANIGGGFSNTAVVDRLVDGQSHFYTDTLTVIVEPAI